MKVEVVGKETSCTLGKAMATGGWLTLTAVRKMRGEGKKKKKKEKNPKQQTPNLLMQYHLAS